MPRRQGALTFANCVTFGKSANLSESVSQTTDGIIVLLPRVRAKVEGRHGGALWKSTAVTQGLSESVFKVIEPPGTKKAL